MDRARLVVNFDHSGLKKHKPNIQLHTTTIWKKIQYFTTTSITAFDMYMFVEKTRVFYYGNVFWGPGSGSSRFG
jgi:hypothetical protein